MRTTENVSITVAPSLIREAERIAIKEGRTKSELFREALRRYVLQSQFREIQMFGKAQSKKLGLKSSDLPRLIAEVRQRKTRKKK